MDLIGIFLSMIVVVTNISWFPFVRPRVQKVIAVPFVLFVPGYVAMSILFPESKSEDGHTDTTDDRGINAFKRIALSISGSLLILLITGIVLYLLSALELVHLIHWVSVFVAIGLVGAAWRRLKLPVDERFASSWHMAVQPSVFSLVSTPPRALTAILVLVFFVTAGGVGYNTIDSEGGESFTEFSLLAENDSTRLGTSNYPRTIAPNGSREMIFSVENKENELVSYTVLIEFQRIAVVNNTTWIQERERVQRFSHQLAPNDTWRRQHQVTPTMTGERLRLTYLLYRGEPPRNPTSSNAYRTVYLWVNVSNGSE